MSTVVSIWLWLCRPVDWWPICIPRLIYDFWYMSNDNVPPSDGIHRPSRLNPPPKIFAYVAMYCRPLVVQQPVGMLLTERRSSCDKASSGRAVRVLSLTVPCSNSSAARQGRPAIVRWTGGRLAEASATRLFADFIESRTGSASKFHPEFRLYLYT